MVPKLKLFVGPMFSGKSTKLIHNIERYKLANKKILTFKPRMDNRYTDDGFIVTHSDIHETCYLISSGEEMIEIFEKEDDVSAIAIDEAFMIEGIADATLQIFYGQKIDVLVSSIDISASPNNKEEL